MEAQKGTSVFSFDIIFLFFNVVSITNVHGALILIVFQNYDVVTDTLFP